MDSDKRVLIAIVLSVLILFVYQKVYVAPYLDKTKQQAQQEPKQAQKSDNNRIITVSSDELLHENTIDIENDMVKLEITDRGAFIKQIWAKKFNDSNTQQPIQLLSLAAQGQKNSGPLLLQELNLGWALLEKDKSRARYHVKDPSGIGITKDIILHNSNYAIELRLEFSNESNQKQTIDYKLVGPSSHFIKSRQDEMFIGADIKIKDGIKRFALQRNIFAPQQFLKDSVVYHETPAWLSTRGRYFSLALQPKQTEEACFIEKEDNRGARAGIIIGPSAIMPGEKLIKEYILYAGPNDRDEIKKIQPNMEDVVTFGKFTPISLILHKALKLFNGILHSYGISIIILTLLINIIVMPLTIKSIKAMKSMQQIQPEMEKLKQEYKNKPDKLNKEIMELYKKHKINPLGGCLPMVLQMPIYVALYLMLMKSVELKGARFLWIKDLSEPDAAFKLPQALPVLGSYINILPLLIIAAMFFQQKTSQPGTVQPEQQKIMSMVLPFMFGIMFYNLPSSFALYWLVNTSTMLILQKYARFTLHP